MDAETFRTRSMQYERLLYRVSWSMLGNNEDCADAIQEALARAWQKRGSLRDEEAFRAWLVRILSNVCSDMLRRRARGLVVPLEDDIEANTPEMTPDPLHEMVEQLRPIYRVVTVLHYFEGYSVGEVGKMLGIPAGTVKSRLMCARQQLRELLTEDDGEGSTIRERG